MISRRLIRNCRKLESIWTSAVLPMFVVGLIIIIPMYFILSFRFGAFWLTKALFSHFVDLPSGYPSVWGKAKHRTIEKNFPRISAASNFRFVSLMMWRCSSGIFRNTFQLVLFVVRNAKPFVILPFLFHPSLASHLFAANDTELRRKMTKMCEWFKKTSVEADRFTGDVCFRSAFLAEK